MTTLDRAALAGLLTLFAQNLDTVQRLVAAPPKTADLTAVRPLTEQITAVRDTTTALIQTTTALSGTPDAETPAGQHALSGLADATAHATEATAHLTLALAATAEAHRLRHHPDFYSQHIRLPEIPEQIAAAHTDALNALRTGQDRLTTAAEAISSHTLQQRRNPHATAARQHTHTRTPRPAGPTPTAPPAGPAQPRTPHHTR